MAKITLRLMNDPQRVATGLRQVKQLLRSPKNWTQRYAARNAEGYECLSDAPGAACWCLSGAINRIAAPQGANLRWDMAAACQVVLKGRSIPSWNDEPRRTHKDVLGVLNEAIEVVEQRVSKSPRKGGDRVKSR